MAMKFLKFKERNCLVRDFYLKNHDKGKAYTMKHFRDTYGLGESPVYKLLRRIDNSVADENMERRKGSGRPRALNRCQTQAILRAIEDKKGPSTKKQSGLYHVTQQTIRNTLRCEEAKNRKRQTVLMMSEAQHERVHEHCQILANRYFPVNGRNDIVIDDESYFLLKDDGVRGNDSIWTRDIDSCPDDVRYIQKEKFQKKLLVHATISPKGMSKIFFVPAGNAVKATVYMQILRQRVIPFIREKHSDRRYFFWPHLASAHYANNTLQLLRDENIKFIPKEANPPAVASLRPIEDLWAALKKAVYAGGWEADNFEQLKRQISAKACEIPLQRIINLFRTVRERIRTCAENGYFAVHR